MLDQAFLPFQQIVERLSSFDGDLLDEGAGVHSYIYEFEIESPIEMDVVRDDAGTLRIGSTPPLYDVNTTFRPSFHRLRFTARANYHGS